ncbi:PaaX family transcriptional regulator [Brevibacterium oceani]|uniref:PaaX family transcriptional regulator n=1 Tax=Brevibacterium oceani TaxID=358099 RepID=UPI0015E6B0C3|nr:PaaX family transcriptional regulator C-terminal domain-containing protein [Brevibacterium oceani]
MAVNPQSLFLALAGVHMLDDDRPLSGASIVFVMSRLGVGESAARSVLQRNAAKGFIVRRKQGRKTFYTLSERARGVLREGQEKMFSGWQPQNWDGRWTFVRVPVPESKRALRHQLSSRLSWAGFGQVEGGTWVAPGPHDVAGILGEARAELTPIAVYGAPQDPTTDQILLDAFDLDELAERYEAFGRKWATVGFESQASIDALGSWESLVRRVELHFDWLTLARTDPQLPAALLPEGWPGAVQGERFRELSTRLEQAESAAIEEFFAGLS